jgi:hypothetical protein
VTDNGDGTYSATVTAPTSVGSGVFVATLGGAAVKGGTGSQTRATLNYTARVGGGGGSGGGGVPPDLHVDLTSNASQTPPVGTEVIYFVKVSTKNAGAASVVRLDLTLPAGYTVTRTYTDRGPGCTGSAPKLTCDVAWVAAGTNSNVTIWGTVGQAGEQDMAATVTSLVETEPAATLADNTVTLKLLPPQAPPGGSTSKPPPQLTRALRVSGPARPGGVLHARPPLWSPKPSKVTYQWQLCTPTACRAISGADSLSLKITHAYVGKSVRLEATATVDTRIVKTYSTKIAIRK